jgi:quercetin dioxygenase-like cupin family protein
VGARSSVAGPGSAPASAAGPARRLGWATALLALALTWAPAGCGGRSGSSQPAAGAAAKREALGRQPNPIGAPGRTLGLARVVIPPGVRLPLHRHEGTQVAYVQRGTLTYSVFRGAVEVMRGSSDARPTRVRRIGPGDTAIIAAGQWLVEEPGDVHRAANRGSAPVVVLLASLLRTGAPPATPVARPAGR